MTFYSCTDTHQISAAPNSCRYVILLVPYWKMMSFERNGKRFLVRNCAAFCYIRILSQTQCSMLTRHYHSTTARYGLRNDLFLPILIFDSNSSFPFLRQKYIAMQITCRVCCKRFFNPNISQTIQAGG